MVRRKLNWAVLMLFILALIFGISSAEMIKNTLATGDTKVLSLGEGEVVIFDFTPEEDGIYVFSATKEAEVNKGEDTGFAFLMDTDFHALAQSVITWNGNSIVSEISYELTAGEKVYYCLKSGYYEMLSNIEARVTRLDGLTAYGYSVPATQTDLGDAESSKVLKVSAISTNSSNLSYAWYRIDDKGSRNKIDGENAREYLIPMMTGNENIVCEISDGTNSRDIFFDEEVKDKRFYAYSPDETIRTVNAGEQVIFTAKAGRKAGKELTYSWYTLSEDGRMLEIEGEHSPIFVIAEANHNASYRCIIMDENGAAGTVDYEVQIENGLTVEKSDSVIMISDMNQEILMEVNAGCTRGGLKYQWSATGPGDQILEGETKSDCRVKPSEHGLYYACRVTDQYGNERQAFFFLELENRLNVNLSMVKDGDTIQLAVSASSESGRELFYQWYRSDPVILDGMIRFFDQPIKDANESTYTIRNPYITTSSSNNTTFYCVVSDGISKQTISSRVYGSYFNRDFTVLEQQNLSVNYGEPIQLSTYTDVYNGPDPTYQWYMEVGGRSHRVANDSEDPSLLITDPITERTTYVCYVSNGTFTKVCRRNIIPLYNLQLRPEEEMITVNAGEAALMSVQATGASGTPSYQWYRGCYYSYNNRNSGWFYEVIDGATSATYSESPQRETKYLCVARDGSQIDTAHILVKLNSDFSAEAVGLTAFRALPGEEITLKVNATSSAVQNLSFRWFKLHESQAWDGDLGSVELDGENKSAFSFVVSESHHYYACHVSDGYNSEDIEFSIDLDNNLSVRPAGDETSYTVKIGGDVTLRAMASCYDGNMHYEWYDSTADENRGEGTVGENGRISVHLSDIRESKSVYCVVTDDYGNNQWVYYWITVVDEIVLHSEKFNYPKVGIGEKLTMAVSATNSSGKPIKYRWYRKLRNGSEWNLIQGATEASYQEVYEEIFDYYCEITSDGGWFHPVVNAYFYPNVESYLTLTIEPDPDTPPQGKSSSERGDYAWTEYRVDLNSHLLLRVRASASEKNLVYQWYRVINTNGYEEYERIEGECGSVYYLTKIDKEEKYRCSVTDGTRNAMADFSVAVNSGLNVVWNHAAGDLYLSEGESITVSVTAENDIPGSVFSYQWRESGVQLEESTPSLTMNDIRSTKHITCEVSDGYQTKSLSLSIYCGKDLFLMPAQTVVIPDIKGFYNMKGINLHFIGNETACIDLADTDDIAFLSYYDSNDTEHSYYFKPVGREVLQLPVNLTEIGEDAFAGNPLIRIIRLGASVQSVGNRAFSNMGKLQVEISGEQVSFENDPFAGSDVIILCLPGSTAEAYAREKGIPYFLYEAETD